MPKKDTKNICLATLDNAEGHATEVDETARMWIAEYPPAFRQVIDDYVPCEGLDKFLRHTSAGRASAWEVVGDVRVPVIRLTAEGRRQIASQMGVQASAAMLEYDANDQ